jgi:hypothetical protein
MQKKWDMKYVPNLRNLVSSPVFWMTEGPIPLVNSLESSGSFHELTPQVFQILLKTMRNLYLLGSLGF